MDDRGNELIVAQNQANEAASQMHWLGLRSESVIETGHKSTQVPVMAMSVEQIVSEARQLPREQAAELFDRLLMETFTTPDPETDAAWKQEIQRRIADIESGRERGIDGDEVMAELRKIVGR